MEEAAEEAEREKEEAVAAAKQEAETENAAALAAAETDCQGRLQAAADQAMITLNTAVTSAVSAALADLRTEFELCTQRTPDGTVNTAPTDAECAGSENPAVCGVDNSGLAAFTQNPCLPVSLL